MNFYSWGPVSAGPLIAGIAAGLQPEIVELSKVFPNEPPERKTNLSTLLLDNRWIATLAGDDTFIFSRVFCAFNM